MAEKVEKIITTPEWPAKINIGCGYDKRLGHLNVDMDPHCSPDILITNNNFSQLPREHFETLVANDVLEHIPRSQTMNALLEWADLVQVGGMMELKTSNVIAIAEMMKASNAYALHDGYTVFFYGNQMHPGDFHYTGFTHVTLPVLLTAAGFEVLDIREHDTWLLVASARKKLSWTALLKNDLGDQEFVYTAYQQALQREPEPPFFEGEMELARTDRRGLLKKLFGCQERQLRVARALGF